MSAGNLGVGTTAAAPVAGEGKGETTWSGENRPSRASSGLDQLDQWDRARKKSHFKGIRYDSDDSSEGSDGCRPKYVGLRAKRMPGLALPRASPLPPNPPQPPPPTRLPASPRRPPPPPPPFRPHPVRDDRPAAGLAVRRLLSHRPRPTSTRPTHSHTCVTSLPGTPPT